MSDDHKIIGGAVPNGYVGGTYGEGIFDRANGQSWYERLEPETGWALERRPGQPYRPGMQDAGLVMIGPAMGDNGDASNLFSRIWPWLVGGAVGIASLVLLGTAGVGAFSLFTPPKRNPKRRRKASRRPRKNPTYYVADAFEEKVFTTRARSLSMAQMENRRPFSRVFGKREAAQRWVDDHYVAAAGLGWLAGEDALYSRRDDYMSGSAGKRGR